VTEIEEIYSAKTAAWELCALSLYREGVLDGEQLSQVIAACPYHRANRMRWAS